MEIPFQMISQKTAIKAVLLEEMQGAEGSYLRNRGCQTLKSFHQNKVIHVKSPKDNLSKLLVVPGLC